MNDFMIEKVLPFLRDNGMEDAADEIIRLQLCERRLMAIVQWIEKAHPNDFKKGLWEKIAEA